MAEIIDRLQAALADRYVVERELGAGGMATVYLAHDRKHERKVALKVLRPELAAALGAERFTREIRIAAQLQHPHILPLHDSGEADGFLYYTMPYVEGESLGERLARSGELPIDEAIRILREILDALAHAHEHGVVHRDLKPDNVMLSKRHALVMDFGVAKAVSEATGRHQVTTAGVALGTPAYMAPEQATADPHTDHRADIYAVGVVAYELLTGSPPFTGPNPRAVLSAHVMDDPAPVTARRASVPAPLAALVMRCLAKKPADRWQSAEEMLPVLEGLATPSGGITPSQTRPVPAVRPRRRNMALIAAALAGAGALAATGFLLRGGSGGLDLAPVERQVTFRGDVTAVALARDGRTIAYRADERPNASFDARSGALIVQDLAGGGSITLLRLEDPGLRMNDPYWGPEDARVFFNLWSDTSEVIASVPRLGGPLRIEVDLLRLRRPDIFFGGFTASGDYLIAPGPWLYVGNAPKTVRWVNQDSLAGDGRLLRIAATGQVVRPILSPDGRWIAYHIGDEGRSSSGLISMDGRRRSVLVEGGGDLVPLPIGWNAAGNAIYFWRYSNRRTDIVKLPINPNDGARAGDLVVVTQGLKRSSSGYLIEGTTLLYAGDMFSRNLKAIDLAGAPRTSGNATALTRGTASNFSPVLTPDGEAALFARATDEGSDILILPIGGGAERLLTQQNGVMAGRLAVSRDGSRIAFYEFVAADQLQLVIVDIATGHATELPQGAGVQVGWAPDGQHVATTGIASSRVVLIDLRDSSEVAVPLQCDTTCSIYAVWPVFSPDGTRIALTDGVGRGLWIVALPGGHATRITGEVLRTLIWTERGIYYVSKGSGPSGSSHPVVYRIAPEGGSPQLYARLPADCNLGGTTRVDLALSLDASTAVCTVVDYKPDVHIVENFDRTERR